MKKIFNPYNALHTLSSLYAVHFTDMFAVSLRACCSVLHSGRFFSFRLLGHSPLSFKLLLLLLHTYTRMFPDAVAMRVWTLLMHTHQMSTLFHEMDAFCASVNSNCSNHDRNYAQTCISRSQARCDQYSTNIAQSPDSCRSSKLRRFVPRLLCCLG